MTTLRILLLTLFVAGSYAAGAQDEWPRIVNSTNGSIIKVYEPQPESLSGNILKSRAAVSIQKDAQSEPVFGTFWSVNTVETDRDNRRVSVQSVRIPNIKFPEEVDAATISYVKTTLESGLPAVQSDLPLDVILTSLEANAEQKKLSQDMGTKAPKVFYASKPSMLVSIDGEPKFKENKDWGVSVVVNSPFTIVKNNDGAYYLYGGKKWYKAPKPLGPYTYVANAPDNLDKVATAVSNQNNSEAGYRDSADVAQSDMVLDVITTTVPAELIQTKGNPAFTDISGTGLQYAENSENDLFLDTDAQQYYVLLSGRWYRADKLNGNWNYVASSSLPSDFTKIPEGSPKDNVLASVPGTSAAREAVMDAQIPQTAKVDRHNASTSVTYDGQPKFEQINGTQMDYAVNSQSSVIRYNGRYYAVDKGVWFVSDSPNGPWEVSTERPGEVDAIPPSSPAYNLKYVYIYDVTPDYVYMGYTPGYLNNFIYGGTVIYGTGYAYTPWWGSYYYPRPYTWGFGVSYNPWWGWSLGFGYGHGWFNGGFGYSAWPGWGGGWWGPSIYRPPFRYHSGYYRPGFYGPRYSYSGRGNRGAVIPGGRMGGRAGYNGGRVVNNIYNYRNDVVSNGRYGGSSRPNASGRMDGNFNGGRNGAGSSRPGYNGGRTPSNGGGRVASPNSNGGRVYTDGGGNVYQRGNQGQWQQRDRAQWQPVDNNRRETIRDLNRQQQMQSRGEQRSQNFQQYRNNTPAGGGSRPQQSGGNFSRPAPSGGGNFSRPSGGGFSRPSGGGGSRPSGGGGGGGSRPGGRGRG